MTAYYARYEEMVDELCIALEACNHPKQPFCFDIRDKTYCVCEACFRAVAPLDDAIKAEHRAARKRELAARPRCSVESCNRRATVKTFSIRLCNLHFKRFERKHYRAARCGGLPVALNPASYDSDTVRKMATV